MLAGKRLLLIIAGGIAAYKSLDLIRRLRERAARLEVILTKGGAQFITPLSVSALAGGGVHTDLFALDDEARMGHIRLARETDLVLIAPASADLLARMAQGRADDLAAAVLLATRAPIMIAPAMNPQMWAHPATSANMALLEKRGVMRVGPGKGDMACGEWGEGRMAEVEEILAAVENFFHQSAPLSGKRALVTSGPTFEAIDPVRFIANRSSGRQGHALAAALARAGARTTLISGPVSLEDPEGVETRHVESAREMYAAVMESLPMDIAICAAAVADWRPANPEMQKMKKPGDGTVPTLSLCENPDILKSLAAAGNQRPALLIGFAAETQDVVRQAGAKRQAKGCDWIVANNVSSGAGVFGGQHNTVHIIDEKGIEDWPEMSKPDVAQRLVERIARHFTQAA